MHAVSHSLTHRGPSATSRARSRWQPYASTSTTQTRSPTPAYLNTPQSNVSSPALQFRPATAQVSNSISRQALKSRVVATLVDQTVKSLCEIWSTTQVPRFSAGDTTSIAATFGSHCPTPSSFITRPNKHLPSPLTPSTLSTPPLSPESSAPDAVVLQESPINPVPLKSFVLEVLRRSRTSGSVLSTALCYLEAVRRQVPDIARQNSKQATPSGLAEDVEAEVIPSPERPLPSPLLCPRRTFLASLILASKFLQDRCYSNRAWAKLSGLSPREISRCEKALGDALDWRLWVGKTTRPLIRSQSQQDLSSSQRVPTVRTLARAHTVPSLGTPSALEAWMVPQPFVRAPLDPYQEWLLLNQSRLSEETSGAEEYTALPSSMEEVITAPGRPSIGDIKEMLTPPTPALTISPTSTVYSSAESVFDVEEGDRTVQVNDISDLYVTKEPGEQAWHIQDSNISGTTYNFDLSLQSKNNSVIAPTW